MSPPSSISSRFWSFLSPTSGWSAWPGSKLYVREHKGEKVTEAVVREVWAEPRHYFVHFLGWNSKFDEWYTKKSPKLAPAKWPGGAKKRAAEGAAADDASPPGWPREIPLPTPRLDALARPQAPCANELHPSAPRCEADDARA